MISYVYPKRESSGKHSAVMFYYCAEFKPNKGENGEKARHIHGTVLNANKEVILKPDFYVTYTKLTGENIKKYHISDCTVVNFYYFGGVWMMGTRNSWNIADICEFQNVTNQALFDEVVENKGYNIDFNLLDKSKIHTFAFSNPRCHFLSNDYAIWAYDPKYEFVDKPEEFKNEHHYIALNPATGELGVQQSQIWKDITNKMYTNRISIVEQESNWEIAVAKILLRVLFDKTYSYETICQFFNENLNTECKRIFEVVKKVVEEVDRHFKNDIRQYKGLKIPPMYLEGLSEFDTILAQQDRCTKNFIIGLISMELEGKNEKE